MARDYEGLNNLDFANLKRVCETIEGNILGGEERDHEWEAERGIIAAGPPVGATPPRTL